MILKCHGLKQLLVLAMQLDGRCRVSIIYTQYKHKLALRWHFTHPPLYQRHMPLLDNRLHRSSTCWPVRPHFTTDKIYWSRQPRTGSNTKATTWLSLSWWWLPQCSFCLFHPSSPHLTLLFLVKLHLLSCVLFLITFDLPSNMTIALRLGLLQRTQQTQQRNQCPWTTCMPRTRTAHQQYQQRQRVGGIHRQTNFLRGGLLQRS